MPSSEQKKASNRAWYKRHRKEIREKASARHRRRKYGLSPKQFEELIDNQNGLCAICSETLILGNKFATDHNHATGKVRGLLCRACNLGLGNFKDNPNILASAINYVRIHNGESTF